MRRTVIGVSILVILVLGAGLFIWFSQEEEVTPMAKPPRELSAELLGQRGPRPTETRLRDGARQIEDPAKALEMARESLKRVETELASASDDAERAKLERKRQLVSQTIERLTTR